MSFKKNQNGFGVVEGLLLVIALTLICGVGFYVFSENRKTDSQQVSNTKPQEQVTSEPKKDITSNWYEYKSFSGNFSMKIPDGWQLSGSEGLGGMAALCDDPSCVTYKEGIKAIVTKSDEGRGGPFRFFLWEGESSIATNNFNEQGKVVEGFKAGELIVKKKVFVQNQEPEGLGIPKGGKEYSYLITKGNKGFYITYATYSQSENDEVEIVDKALSTFKILD